MEFFTYRLPNGIRGIHRQVKSNVAHCALVVNAGSRDEHPDQYGLAHFTEHAFFKGTRRRRAWQVNCRLENLGGELNAFTTKEDTTIHATTLRGDFPKADELIADIAFRSTFPDRELEREKEVIADEINTYKDSPADLIYDTFEEMLFAGSELGHNILGRKAALMRYDGDAIRAFTGRTHTTDQMVFSSIGNFSAKTAETVAARYFAQQAATTRGFVRAAIAPRPPFEKTVVKHTHQTHCIIGGRAYGIGEEKRLPIVDGDAEARFLGGIEQPVHALGGVGVGVDADGIAGIILRFRHRAARQRQHHRQCQQHRYEFLHYRNASSFEMLFCISDCFYHTTFSLSCKVLICYFHHHLVAFFPFSPMFLDVSVCFITACFHELENLRTKNSMGVYFPCCKEP